jgi:hypothetical protein
MRVLSSPPCSRVLLSSTCGCMCPCVSVLALLLPVCVCVCVCVCGWFSSSACLRRALPLVTTYHTTLVWPGLACGAVCCLLLAQSIALETVKFRATHALEQLSAHTIKTSSASRRVGFRLALSQTSACAHAAQPHAYVHRPASACAEAQCSSAVVGAGRLQAHPPPFLSLPSPLLSSSVSVRPLTRSISNFPPFINLFLIHAFTKCLIFHFFVNHSFILSFILSCIHSFQY